MKEGQPVEIRLADYRAPGYTTTDTNLVFDIHDGQTRVTSTLTVKRLEAEANTLQLYGQSLELVSVKVDGRLLSGNEYQLDEEGLELNGLDASHQIEIETLIKPEENTALEGLYRSSKMYCTQCEAEGFRKITYYQDRPDVLAKFTTTVIADGEQYPTLLSNGNCVASETLDGGRRSVTWEDPFPKPSYLFALVAGDLEVLEDEFITRSGRSVKLQIFSEPHNIGQCGYAMDVLKRSMRWDEERFGREYDLDIFMIVAVEDFNMGAMENKGLNIFNTSCVLASPDTATDAAYERVEAVVAHEYFHNWSGNRVTCRDWFQLSLKEGFTVFRDAEFSSDMNSRAVKRIDDVKFLRAVQFAEDASPLAHPVRPQQYIEISNFYTTTIYEKGAEVVRMYHTLLGEEAFRAGSDAYFDRFDGSAATTDDFAEVMAEAGGIDLTQFKLWYDQAGTPQLVVRESFDDGVFCLTIEQRCEATPNQPEKLPFHMPIVMGLIDPNSGSAVDLAALQIEPSVQLRSDDILFSLRDSVATMKMSGLQEKPVVSFLRNFSAPVKVHYERPDEELALLAKHDADGFVRWDALQSIWLNHFAQNTIVDPLTVVGELAQQASVADVSVANQLLFASMLTVPEVDYLFEQLDHFEVVPLLAARDATVMAMAEQHATLWAEIYARYAAQGGFSADASSMAARSLRNIAFSNLALGLGAQEAGELISSHYHRANNLTDRRAALSMVCRHPTVDAQLTQEILLDFYNKWQHEALVMDQWFNLQASSPKNGVAEIQALERHELFNPKNPNRARAVFAAFGMLNHHNFHADDGSGYDYLADAVLRIDAMNPQLAARLCTPLTRWQRYEPARRSMMSSRLERMTANELSKDLYEIVTKSLP